MQSWRSKNSASSKDVAHPNASFLITFMASAAFGVFLVLVALTTTTFIVEIGFRKSILLAGIVLTLAGSASLWHLLKAMGDGASVWKLRRMIRESEASIQSLKQTELELNKELRASEVELTRSYRYFRQVLQTFDMATFYFDNEHRLTWSHNFSADTKTSVGKLVTSLVPGESGQTFARLLTQAMHDGEVHEGQIRILVDDEVRQYIIQVAPRHDRDGQIIGTICVSKDVTEKARWHQHLAEMTLEVNHRARNLLAIVVSILNHSGKSAATVVEYKSKILNRVFSLAKSIDLISQDSWTASSMRRLVVIQLEHVLGKLTGKIEITGTEVCLKSKAIQNVGFAIHELATNAVRHGALSQDMGTVRLSWDLSGPGDDQVLKLRWEETGGELAPEQIKSGMGLQILNNIAAQELGGDSSIEWTTTGMAYEMSIPGNWVNLSTEQAELAMAPLHEGQNTDSTYAKRCA